MGDAAERVLPEHKFAELESLLKALPADSPERDPIDELCARLQAVTARKKIQRSALETLGHSIGELLARHGVSLREYFRCPCDSWSVAPTSPAPESEQPQSQTDQPRSEAQQPQSEVSPPDAAEAEPPFNPRPGPELTLVSPPLPAPPEPLLSLSEATAQVLLQPIDTHVATLLWRLVADADVEAGYWLSRALEQSGGEAAVPSWMLAAVTAARHLCAETQPLAADLLAVASAHRPQDSPVPEMLGLAAALCPAVVAPRSGMIDWLESPGFCPALGPLVTAVREFAEAGHPLLPADLDRVTNTDALGEVIGGEASRVLRWTSPAYLEQLGSNTQRCPNRGAIRTLYHRRLRIVVRSHAGRSGIGSASTSESSGVVPAKVRIAEEASVSSTRHSIVTPLT